MKLKIIAFCVALIFVITPAHAATLIYPEVYKYAGNITCPSAYPIKTGETSGGQYFTSCWSELAWSFYMAGGDEWTTWVNGEYVAPPPEPVPVPTITVTPAPKVINNTITQRVVEPCPSPQPMTVREMRQQIKELKRQVKNQRQAKRQALRNSATS